ncbi:MAG TPA: UDP-glucose 4-epimerase GalE [Candidatus Saccharimonadales bacterium]|nr:UDP-glucose 4-epimerase GalE [Candidatus Saccharimonadales bacterium]
MKNVLVTGGAGFIGSHTVVELASAGYRPVILDNFSNSDPSVIEKLESIIGSKISTYKGNFQDSKLLANIFSVEKIDGIIHFAAYKAVGESVEKPLEYYDNNVSGLISLLEFLRSRKISAFIFSSSCTVYGEPDKLPIKEDAPVKPAESPYGATKQMGEIILRDTTRSGGLRSMALRYFNPIGAHPSAEIGELPRGVPANLVPFITQAAAGLRDELTVFGDDYPTPDGTCIRDYIHVVDLAQAHIKALEYVAAQPGHFYDVCNIGTGIGTSVLETIKTFEKITGQKVPYKIGPRRAGDVVAAYASVDKANKLLGWKAEKTLADALSDAWRWQQAL